LVCLVRYGDPASRNTGITYSQSGNTTRKDVLMKCKATTKLATTDEEQKPIEIIVKCDLDVGHRFHHHDPDRGEWADWQIDEDPKLEVAS
jgi:hypothetical protein